MKNREEEGYSTATIKRQTNPLLSEIPDESAKSPQRPDTWAEQGGHRRCGGQMGPAGTSATSDTPDIRFVPSQFRFHHHQSAFSPQNRLSTHFFKPIHPPSQCKDSTPGACPQALAPNPRLFFTPCSFARLFFYFFPLRLRLLRVPDPPLHGRASFMDLIQPHVTFQHPQCSFWYP